MATKKVICSFDYENDKQYYYLLEAWNENDNIGFHISDCTPREIQSQSISVIKQQLSWKIGDANYMIAIIGKHSNDLHKDYREIGYRNWQSYEIAKNYEKGNILIVVLLDQTYTIPEECKRKNAVWVYGFNLNKIKNALDEHAR